MPPELINAVKERVDLGHSDESIKTELVKAGYEEAIISQVLATAKGKVSNIPPASDHTDSDLPGVSELFKQSFKAVLGRLDLMFLLFVPMLVATLTFIFTSDNPWADNPEFNLVSGIVSLVSGLVYLLILLSVVYIVSQSKEKKISVSEGFSWTMKHGLGLVWVMLLTSFAVLGGVLLFIIPGVIIAVYLYLTQIVYAKEGVKGMDALMRSRELIYGQWMPVFLRYLGLMLIIILLSFGLGLVLALLLTPLLGSMGDNSLIQLAAIGVWDNLINAFATLFGLFVGIHIYQSLAKTKPTYDAVAGQSAKTKYKVLAWLGPAFFISLMVVMFALYQADPERFDSETLEVQMDSFEAKERAMELRLEETIEIDQNQL